MLYHIKAGKLLCAVKHCIIYVDASAVTGNCNLTINNIKAGSRCLGTVTYNVICAVESELHLRAAGIEYCNCFATLTVIKDDVEAGVILVLVNRNGCALIGEDAEGSSDCAQTCVIEEHIVLVRAFLKNIPSEVVNFIRGLVRVVIEAVRSLFIGLGTEHFLTCLEEYDTLGGEEDSCAETVHSESCANTLSAVGDSKLIPESAVIVCGEVVNYHVVGNLPPGSRTANNGTALNAEDNLCASAGITADVTLGSVVALALKTYTHSIVEYCDSADCAVGSNDLGDVTLVSGNCAGICIIHHLPALTVDDSLRIDVVNR